MTGSIFEGLWPTDVMLQNEYVYLYESFEWMTHSYLISEWSCVFGRNSWMNKWLTHKDSHVLPATGVTMQPAKRVNNVNKAISIWYPERLFSRYLGIVIMTTK